MISDPKLPFASNQPVSGNSIPGAIRRARSRARAGSCFPAFASRRPPFHRTSVAPRVAVLSFVFLCATLGVMS